MDSELKFPKSYYQYPHPGLHFADDADIRQMYGIEATQNNDGFCQALVDLAMRRDPIVAQEIRSGIFKNVNALALKHITKCSDEDTADPTATHPFDSLQYEAVLKFVEEKYLNNPLKSKTVAELLRVLKTIAFHSIPMVVRAQNEIKSGYRNADVVVCKTDCFSTPLPEDVLPFLQQHDPLSISGYNEFLTTLQSNGNRIHGVTFSLAARTFMEKYFFISETPPDAIEGAMDALAQELKKRLSDPSLDPIETAAWVHGQIGKIHPFPDANGRTARTVVGIILLQAGLPAPLFSSEHDYSAAVNAEAQQPGSFASYLRQLLDSKKI